MNDTDLAVDEPPRDTAKRRQCLRCETPFQSTWAGERICGRCKSSHGWRVGVPLTSPARTSRSSAKI